MLATQIILACPKDSRGFPVFHCPACGQLLFSENLSISRACHHLQFTFKYDTDKLDCVDERPANLMGETEEHEDPIPFLTDVLEPHWLIVALEGYGIARTEDELVAVGLDLTATARPLESDRRASPFLIPLD